MIGITYLGWVKLIIPNTFYAVKLFAKIEPLIGRIICELIERISKFNSIADHTILTIYPHIPLSQIAG